MKPALVLVDLQNDFLAARRIVPSAGFIVEGAERLLRGFRARNLPVIHLWLTVSRHPDNRMPHWKPPDYQPPAGAAPGSAALGRWICEEGTRGHQPPVSLMPLAGERIVHKQFFNGFGPTARGELEAALRSADCDTVVFAGVHLHGCVRDTAFGAYESGYRVWIAEDAVGSDDPLHAAIARRYLARRTVRFAPGARLLEWIDAGEGVASRRPPAAPLVHVAPADCRRELFRAPASTAGEIEQSASAARAALGVIGTCTPASRGEALLALASALLRDRESFARLLVDDVGKPIALARGEVDRSIALLQAIAAQGSHPLESRARDRSFRYRPLGVIAVVTPWNNPLAIPVGKLAPAFLYGNACLWKPALPGTRIAGRLLDLLPECGWPQNSVCLCPGDQDVACALASHRSIDGVTLSGSERAGYALHEICADRQIPFQAELGGNNAAIVCDDADLDLAAGEIAAGAFGFAGQRCTANRRAIVCGDCFGPFLERLLKAAGGLPLGDPSDPSTAIGPVISLAKRDQILALLGRARHAKLKVFAAHGDLPAHGAYVGPHIVLADDPRHEIVQEESFAPVLVVQRAESFDHALALCNGVRQGLVAALFSNNADRQRAFLERAQAGILKLNRSTVDADATSPFGGWKASGIGPAEHGPSDREFFTRVQTIYGQVSQ